MSFKHLLFSVVTIFSSLKLHSQIIEIPGNLDSNLNIDYLPGKISIFIFEKKYKKQSDLMERLAYFDIDYSRFRIIRINLSSGVCKDQSKIKHKLNGSILEPTPKDVPEYHVVISTRTPTDLDYIKEHFKDNSNRRKVQLLDSHVKSNSPNKILFISFNLNKVTKYPEIMESFFNLIKRDNEKLLFEFKDSMEIVLDNLKEQIESNKPKLNIEIGFLNSLHLITSNFKTPNLKITENKFNELHIGLNVQQRITGKLTLTNFIGFSTLNWTTNIKSNQQLYQLGQHTDNFGDQFDLLLNTNSFSEKIGYSTTNFNYGIGVSFKTQDSSKSNFYLKPQIGISIKSNITQELSDMNFSAFRVYPILNFDTILHTSNFSPEVSGLKPNETFLNFNVQIGYNYSVNNNTNLRVGLNYFISNQLFSTSNPIFEIQSNTINFHSNTNNLNTFRLNGLGISLGFAQSF
jgi:hypothetical protein